MEGRDNKSNSKKSHKKGKGKGKGNNQPPQKKDTLRTSEDVINRLLWDQTVDPSLYIIDYLDRFDGMKQIQLTRFKSINKHLTEGSDEPFSATSVVGQIPFHRIWKIRKGDEVVWDRVKRYDKIFRSGDTDEIDAQEAKEAKANPVKTKSQEPTSEESALPEDEELEKEEKVPEKSSNSIDSQTQKLGYHQLGKKARFIPIPMYKFTEDKWTEQIISKNTFPSSTVSNLKIITWNVLFDYYSKDRIKTSHRVPVQLQILKELDADIIGLQEVTITFLTDLLRQDWVRNNYYISESEAGNSVSPYGQILLSKFPFRSLKIHRFSRHKSVILGEFLFNQRSFFVPVVHLTSTQKANIDSDAKRSYQLKIALVDGLPKTPNSDAVVLGDFNFGDKDKENEEIPSTWTDTWKHLKSDDPGYTFDITKNALALINSESKTSKRIDRILLRSSSSWNPTSIQIFGTDPINPDTDFNVDMLFPSDHFGLVSTFEFQTPSSQFPDSPIYHLLKKLNAGFESDEYKTKRETAVQDLELIVREVLANHSALESDDQLSDALEAIDHLLYVFGSTGLGVSGNESDVDIICIGPKNLSFQEFFDLFVEVVTVGGTVTEIRKVDEAIVPVIKMKVKGVPVDMLYAKFPEEIELKSLDQLEENDLVYFDEVSARSLSGYCDSEKIRHEVKEILGMWDEFRIILATVKLWAKVRGIYSAAMGFLGGFSWSILVAYFLQNVKKSEKTNSVEEWMWEFFKFYKGFEFEKKKIAITKESTKNYKRQTNKKDMLCVVTPSYPFSNSTRNSAYSNIKILKQEFWTAEEKSREAIEIQRKSTGPAKLEETSKIWQRKIFGKSDFFVRYDVYLLVDIKSANKQDVKFSVGFVESRLVALVYALEKGFLHDQEVAGVFDGFEVRLLPAHFVNLVNTGDGHQTATFCVGLQKPKASDKGKEKEDDVLGANDMKLMGATRGFEMEFSNWLKKPVGSSVTVTRKTKDEIVKIVPKKCLPNTENQI